MKTALVRIALACSLVACCSIGEGATIPASEDSASLKGKLTVATNKAGTLPIDGTRRAFVFFDLSDLPTGAQLRYARLRVYFPTVLRAAGGLTLHEVTGQWSESAVSAEPAFDPAPVATFAPATIGTKRFVSVDVTATVQGWLANPANNEGFAVVAIPGGTAKLTASLTLGAKEGSGSGYLAELDVEIADDPIAAGSIQSAQIAPGAVQATNIGSGAVGTLQLANGAVGTLQIADGAIGTIQIAGGAVGTLQIANGAVGTNQIATGAVGSDAIAAGVVNSIHLAQNLNLGGTTTGAFSGNGGGLTNLNVAAVASATATANFMPFVTVGFPGNAADATGFGAVAESFKIGKHEVTNAQFAQFLNAVAAIDDIGLFNSGMASDPRGGIARIAGGNGFSYVVRKAMGDKPVNFVSWYDAIRFCNWMHNGRLNGAPSQTTTEDGAYTISGSAPNWTVSMRKAGARVWLPREDEWYKAAYFDPAKNGGVGGYWLYPTRSDTRPNFPGNFLNGDMKIDGLSIANVDNSANWNGLIGNVTSVGSGGAGSESTFGAADMAGNTWEWNDAFGASTNRLVRGGSFSINYGFISTFRDVGGAPTAENADSGFRVAAE